MLRRDPHWLWRRRLWRRRLLPLARALAGTGPGTAAAGSQVSYQISTAPANRPYYLAYSLNLNGSLVLGHSLDIGQPYTVVDQGTTDAAGTATVTRTLPAGAAGATVYLEAVGVTPQGELRDSPPLTLSIQ